MRERERVGDLHQDGQIALEQTSVRRCDRGPKRVLLRLEQPLPAGALDALHHQERLPLWAERKRVNRDHPRVLERPHQPRFAQKRMQGRLRSLGGANALYGHVACERVLRRAVDHPHTTSAEFGRQRQIRGRARRLSVPDLQDRKPRQLERELVRRMGSHDRLVWVGLHRGSASQLRIRALKHRLARLRIRSHANGLTASLARAKRAQH